MRLREFPDPLADWEELEPGMERRRMGFMDRGVLGAESGGRQQLGGRLNQLNAHCCSL